MPFYPCFRVSLLATGLVLSGCSGGTSSESTPDSTTSPATSDLRASFFASATERGLDVSAAVLTPAPEKFLLLSEAERFVLEMNGVRTPLHLDGSGSGQPGDEPLYVATLVAPQEDTLLRIAFERGPRLASAPDSTISMPGSFEIVEAPTSFAEGEEVTFRLSREVKDDALLGLGPVGPTGGCLANRGATFHLTRRDGPSLTCKVEGLTYAGREKACEVGATIIVSREGTIDRGFAPNSTFQASVQRSTKLQLVER